MEEPFTPENYGKHFGGIYDELSKEYDPRAIAVLARLVGAGAAPELGIGIGRIALALQAAGAAVRDVDAWPEMVEVLRAKPGGERISVTIGSFADLPAKGTFSLHPGVKRRADLPGAHAIRLPGRAGFDGASGRAAPARALERLGWLALRWEQR